MPQLSVAQLFDDNADALKLAWLSGPRDPSPTLDSSEINDSSQGLIGHLNLVHPNWIQIFSRTEAAYFGSLSEADQREALTRLTGSGLVCVILSDGEQVPGALADFAAERNVPLLSSPLASLQMIWVIRTYLGRALAEFVTPLVESVGELEQSTALIMERGMQDPDEAGAASSDYLKMYSLVTLGYLWARMASVARAALADGEAVDAERVAFMERKLVTARFFMERVLPEVHSLAAKIEAGGESMMALAANDF